MQREAKEIKIILQKLREELKSLPETSTLGTSNAESRVELKEWIGELERAQNGTLPDPNSEVFYWLTKKNYSALDDYS